MLAGFKASLKNAVMLFFICYYFRFGVGKVGYPLRHRVGLCGAFIESNGNGAVAFNIKIALLMIVLALSYRVERDNKIRALVFLGIELYGINLCI